MKYTGNVKNQRSAGEPLTELDLIRAIRPCPRAGNGVHRYLWREACNLWKVSEDPQLIIRALTKAVIDCGREVPPAEIENAVLNSSPENPREASRFWPSPDERRIKHIIQKPGSLDLLRKLSPVDPVGKPTAYFVDELFKENPLLCFGKDQRQFWTRRRSEFQDLSQYQFIVPSSMIYEVGITKTKTRSARCLDNTGPRNYLIVEFDSGTEEEQAAKILHLAERAPLSMVVYSGGKSLHSWFKSVGQSEEDLWEFMAYAVSLGADPHTWTRCQLVRVPAATRDNGKEQSVLFFNPSGIEPAGSSLTATWNFVKIKAAKTDLLELDLFFDPAFQRYLFPTEQGWISLSKENLEDQLLDLGYRARADKKAGEVLSPVKEICVKVQRTKHVAYAAPLAGHKKGLHSYNGEQILVTKSPHWITPIRGEFNVLNQIFENMFVNGSTDQRPYLHAWIKIAVEALFSGCNKPGQALVLAGQAGSGKSLLQSIITDILGGRSAKPFRYMTGQTTFNGELFQAEHLIIEDEASSFNTLKRVEFGTRIKEVTVNQTHSCHPKNRQAIQLRPFWRLSISLNDEPEHLQILPPVDDSISDKLMLFQIFKQPMPMPTRTPEEVEAFGKRIKSELPAYLFWLQNWSIPTELRDDRYGVKMFHHPTIKHAIENLAPEMRLLEFLRLWLSQPNQGHWVGTAVELENELQRCYPEIRCVLSWNGAMGTYLGRLARKFPTKVAQVRSSEFRKWEIARDL